MFSRKSRSRSSSATSDIDDVLSASSSNARLASNTPPGTNQGPFQEITAPPPAASRRSSSDRQRRLPLTPEPMDILSHYSSNAGAAVESEEPCACKRAFVSKDSVNCGICQNTIGILFDLKRDRMTIIDQLERAQKELEAERVKQDKYELIREKNETRIKELEDALDQQADEIITLRNDFKVISQKLVAEVEQRVEIQAELDEHLKEVENLTAKLFEQANVMVADEAKRRYAAETELSKTVSKLQKEQTEVVSLRRKLSDVSLAASLRSSNGDIVRVKDLEIRDPTSGLVFGEIPTNDVFASLDPDLLPDKRFYYDFYSFFLKCPNYPITKLAPHIPFVKYCIDEHVEPCAKLGKLSPKKIIDSILNNSIRIAVYKEVIDEVLATKSESSPPRVYQNLSTGSGIVQSSSTSSIKSLGSGGSISPEHSRAASPIKLWAALTSNSSIPSSPNTCGGCGRETRCNYTLTFAIPNSPFPSSSKSETPATQLYICTWCRDRIYSVWEFYAFLKRLMSMIPRKAPDRSSIIEIANANASESSSSSATTEKKSLDELIRESKTSPDLFIEFLRLLKMLFYSRIGIMSYFRKVEDGLRELEMSVDRTTDSAKTPTKTDPREEKDVVIFGSAEDSSSNSIRTPEKKAEESIES